MILPSYPQYADSGVEWLGDIPSYWEWYRAKQIFNVIDIRSQTGDEEILTVSSSDGVVPRSQKKVTMFQAKSYVGHKLCWQGDLVVNSLWAWQTGLGFSKYHGVISSAYSVYRPKNEYSDYWHYFNFLLRSSIYKWEFVVRSKGVWTSRLQLLDDEFMNIPIVIPPPDEQAAIVAFLDVADKRIQHYIRAKQKLIALLNEQKQAIIQQAVTRGLNPDVPMKDSGIEWLGEIPSHWEVTRSKFVFCEANNRSITGEEPHLSMSQKHGLIASNELDKWRMLSESYIGAKICEKNDLVLNRLKAHLGVFAIAPQRGLVSPDYTVFRAIRPINPYFFEALFRTPLFRVELKKRSKGIVEGFWRLYTDDFYEIFLPLPSLDEQSSIMESVGGKLNYISSLIDKTYDDINLIREYRTRLIADVVTGKLDVRGAVFDMSAEFDETDLPDVADDEFIEESMQDYLGEDEDENGYERTRTRGSYPTPNERSGMAGWSTE